METVDPVDRCCEETYKIKWKPVRGDWTATRPGAATTHLSCCRRPRRRLWKLCCISVSFPPGAPRFFWCRSELRKRPPSPLLLIHKSSTMVTGRTAVEELQKQPLYYHFDRFWSASEQTNQLPWFCVPRVSSSFSLFTSVSWIVCFTKSSAKSSLSALSSAQTLESSVSPPFWAWDPDRLISNSSNPAIALILSPRYGGRISPHLYRLSRLRLNDHLGKSTWTFCRWCLRIQKIMLHHQTVNVWQSHLLKHSGLQKCKNEGTSWQKPAW